MYLFHGYDIDALVQNFNNSRAVDPVHSKVSCM